MPDWWAVNAPKISKAVFLLLQRCHRSHGLAVLGWRRPPGNGYFSFFSLAVRHPDGRAKHVPDTTGECPLTTYQDHVSVPGWASGLHHYWLPDWDRRGVGARELLAWYEKHLSLRLLFDRYADAIARWRRTFLAEEAERYLLMWNVLGLFVASRPQGVWTFGRSEDPGLPPPPYELEVLPADRPNEMVHFCDEFVFHTGGRVLVDREAGEIVDLWEPYVRGTRPEAMAAALVDRAGGPMPLGSAG